MVFASAFVSYEEEDACISDEGEDVWSWPVPFSLEKVLNVRGFPPLVLPDIVLVSILLRIRHTHTLPPLLLPDVLLGGALPYIVG